MAKTVILTDDIDGSAGAEAVEFAYDGVRYSIDLSKRNQAALSKALKPWISAATKISSDRRRRVSTSGKTRGRRSSGRGANPADVRAWAAEQGIKVSERGRVAQHVLDAYAAAH